MLSGPEPLGTVHLLMPIFLYMLDSYQMNQTIELYMMTSSNIHGDFLNIYKITDTKLQTLLTSGIQLDGDG